jgi:DtxR family Mn-dependent transcriptional regulator
MAEHLTQSEENYIKAIYYINHRSNAPVGTNDLAERMETKASSVTDMIKKLSEKSLITYKKYKGCELTSLGEKRALKLVRKHRLWETFLVEKLNFGWDEVHDIAEELEHINSTKLTSKLDEYLDYPKFDPHGDPIPDSEGEIAKRERTVKLSELKLEQSAIVIGVSDSSPSFLRFLDRHKINIGSSVKVIEIYEFDDSREILFNEQKINLSAEASQKITVQKG